MQQEALNTARVIYNMLVLLSWQEELHFIMPHCLLEQHRALVYSLMNHIMEQRSIYLHSKMTFSKGLSWKLSTFFFVIAIKTCNKLNINKVIHCVIYHI